MIPKGGHRFSEKVIRPRAPPVKTATCPSRRNFASSDAIMTSLYRRAKAHIESITPMGRLAEPEEVAAAVFFLASPAASW
jgi:NAD(P)-dependent dehydrogenase (short-subunit alcohol dehydrogenase family)